jgi:hypothetical protein
MDQARFIQELTQKTKQAVAHYWQSRSSQRQKQEKSGRADQGLRSAVTGGAQMDGFIDLFTELIARVGISERYIFRKRPLTFRVFSDLQKNGISWSLKKRHWSPR